MAVQALGVPPGRLLALGVRDAAVPADGAIFEQIVDAVGFLSWMRDLNVICGPNPDATPVRARAATIAAEVARRTGIGLLTYGPGPGARKWTQPAHAAVKARAVAAHAALPAASEAAWEWFTPWHGG